MKSFETSYVVAQQPSEVFDAIVDVPRWWTGEVEGPTTTSGDEFVYCYPGQHESTQRVTGLVKDRLIEWNVIDAKLANMSDPREWVGTTISFEIVPADNGTQLKFTHQGLVPDFECYEACSSAWGFFINNSLKHLIETGEGPATPPWA